MKLLCIAELAKAGPHASCAIDRSKMPPCSGPLRQLALPEAMDHVPATATEGAPAALPAPPAALPADATSRQPSPEQGALPKDAQQAASPADGKSAPQGGEPQTVEEMVKKSATSTGEALEETGKAASEAAKKTENVLEKAGHAVGGAAKKTWKCLTSLFGDC